MSQKIVIKANVKREPQESVATLTYEWNWRRIVSISMLLLMTSAAVIYGLTSAVSAEQDDHPNEPEDRVLAQSNDTSQRAVTALQTTQAGLNSPATVAPQNSESELLVAPINLVAEQKIAEPDKVVAAELPAAPQAEIKNYSPEPVNIEQVPTTDLLVDTDVAAISDTAPSSTQGFAPLAQLASVALGAQIDTDKISRAVLTRKVSKREPVNVFAADIRLSQFDETLSFFSELKNLQGQQVKHVWFFEDDIVAEIELDITSSRYRTYSTKNIMDSQIGQWRVDVIDEQGQLIAQKEFRILAD
ncbi:hypothetical protein PTRA_a0114 [Pseudoalteromonas translucida KMM 520]|uniref:DUF2914 domain-containing protein n=1 Tax=Pseudoalteromonas translucida KMM 520 TaxID=1315283 RepID=A0A0U2V0Q4_9GAMM|nr:DUF2914 domain-containing protein [Pseudoalteromonas translucida]ALS31500.1 hypothetical protein PTRA_a0114 [Pseudoalteromonas translucida KMM 520]